MVIDVVIDGYCPNCNTSTAPSSGGCLCHAVPLVPSLEDEIAAFERLALAGLAFTEEEIEADIKQAKEEYRRDSHD